MEMEVEAEEILPDPYTASDFLTSSGDFVSQYGWYIFAIVVVLGMNWNRIQKFLDRWYDKRESMTYAEKYHKNPDIVLAQLEAMEKSRLKMQEELNRRAQEHQEKMKERERQQVLEKLAKLEKLEGGNKLGRDMPSSSSSLKSDYNPLMGDSSSRYKPPKRKCPGGGCGGS